jgi:hypothetical protein
MTTMVRIQLAALCRCALAGAAMLAAGPVPLARAEVQVEGNPAAVRVTIDHAAISDVLSALAATFKVTYRTSIALDAPAEATYAGSFGQVMARLLDGYNYVVKTEGGTIEVVVLGRRGEVAIPPPGPKPTPNASVMSRWR